MSENAARKKFGSMLHCPKVIKDILFPIGRRVKNTDCFGVEFISAGAALDFISAIQVPGGADVADDYIVAQVSRRAGDYGGLSRW
ncbi:MAG: hypothetical protein R3C26_26465 [Calditrichia bacterium]